MTYRIIKTIIFLKILIFMISLNNFSFFALQIFVNIFIYLVCYIIHLILLENNFHSEIILPEFYKFSSK